MICIINCGTSWLENIKACLTGYSHKVISLDEINNSDFESFAGIIISGAPTLLTETDIQKRYLELFGFIETVSKPILGICLGHQLIGLVNGSRINKGELIHKQESIEIVNDDIIFSGLENHSLFQEEHSESITLPAGFVLLAKSGSCDNEAMRHKSKKIYGVQFHPEVSGDNGKKIFNNFLKLCRVTR